jgi:hypothetical protein
LGLVAEAEEGAGLMFSGNELGKVYDGILKFTMFSVFVLVPLSLWKLVDIAIWLCKHITISFTLLVVLSPVVSEGQTLPPGYTTLSATMATPNTAGRPRMTGHGATLPLQHAPHLQGEHSTYIWDSVDRRQPAILLRGRDRIVSDFGLLGDAYNPITRKYDKRGNGKPAIGLLMDWDAGLGTGKYSIERLSIQGFRVGIQAGVDGSEVNCDQTSVSKVFFHNCDTGFAFKQAQAMGWYVRETEFEADSPDDAVFYYEGGGDLSAYDTFVPYGCRLLQLNAVDKMFGGNNSGYRFHGIKVDAQAGTDFCLLHSDDTAMDFCLDADVWVDGLMMPIAPDYNGKLLATVTGSTRLTMDGCKVACKLTKALAWRQEDPRFIPSYLIENVRFTGHKSCAELLNKAASKGMCLVIFRDNYTSAGKLPNYTAIVAGVQP